MTYGRRVAITGLGLVTPCGRGWQAYWRSVLGSESHIGQLSNVSQPGIPKTLAGQVVDFDPKEFVKQRKSLKLMSREIQLGVAASHLALQDADINLENINKTRFGISLGTGIINNELDEIGVGVRNSLNEEKKFCIKKFGQEGMRTMYPLWFLKYLPNMPACHISITHGLAGPSNTVTTSAAAGAQAIGEAFHVIQRGDADLMLSGSTDSKVNAMGLSRFHLLGLLSQKNHSSEKAYCPFDKNHDGIILGEGAGLILLEAWEHAKKRGAKIYGEVIGYGSSSDFNYNPLIGEDSTGKRVAMQRAMNEAQAEPKEIDLIHANGSGLPHDDRQESEAIHSIFEKSFKKLKVTGVKPITGHLVYGSAGVEIGASVLSLHEGVVPPLANLNSPDPACDLPFARTQPEIRGIQTVLFNSSGFGGQNASLLVRKV